MKTKRSLEHKLYRSHLTLAAFGVGILLVALVSTLWLQSYSQKTFEQTQPLHLAIQQLEESLHGSISALHAWIAVGQPEARQERKKVWSQGVWPAVAQLEEQLAPNKPLKLKQQLAELEAWQVRIEAVANRPQNEPAQVRWELEAKPLMEEISTGVKQVLQLELSSPKQQVRGMSLQLYLLGEHIHRADQALQSLVKSPDETNQNNFEAESLVSIQSLQALEAKPQGLSSGQAGLLIRLLPQMVKFRELGLQIAQERQEKPRFVSQAWLIQEVAPLLKEINQLTGKLEEQLNQDHQAATQKARQIARLSLGVALLLILAMLVLALVSAKRNSRAITQPISTLVQAAKDFTQGKLSQEITLQADDEFHLLIQAFNQMRRSLEESYGRLQNIVDSAAEGIVILDEEGQIQSFNHAAERIFGYSTAEVLGQPIVQLIVPVWERGPKGGNLKEFFQVMGEALPGKSYQVPGKRKDGSTCPLEVAVSQIEVGGKKLYTGILRDITEQKALESNLIEAKNKAQSANKLKSEFLANMSHEIRTPMNGIIGMVELALESAQNPTQQKQLQAAHSSARALLGILNEILDLSKLEGGHLELEDISFDLVQLLEEATETFALEARQKGLELICQFEADLPRCLSGDPTRLRQVISNLVGNAIKFTPAGEILIKSRPLVLDPKNYQLEISVADTGIGIAPERQASIFESFTQSDGSTTRKYGGTGLGTTIAKQLVELMGGQISLESELGKGSVFTFTFLAKKGDAEALACEPPTDLCLQEVVLVDDNSASLEALRLLLEPHAKRIHSLHHTQALMPLLTRRAKEKALISLIILDLDIPGEDCRDCWQQLQAKTSTASIPVILLSSQDASQLAQGFEKAALLMKPVKSRELYQCLTNLAKGQGPVAPAKPAPASGRLAGMRLLLVEDDKINQMLGRTRLEQEGGVVRLANNGLEAVQAYQEQSFDAILMDVQMPKMDGFAATRAIRELEKGQPGAKIPILAMTANTSPEDQKECQEAGMDAHVAKPLDFERLFSLLEPYVSEHQAEPEAASPPPAPAQVQLTSLPGLDLEAARRRWGDQDLPLAKALAAFGRDHAQSLKRIRQALTDGQEDRAAALIHQFKGTVGNLSLSELSPLAQAMDRLIKQGQVQDLPPLVEQAQGRLEALVAAMARAGLPALLHSQASQSKTVPSALGADAAATLMQVFEQVEHNLDLGESLEAERLLEEIKILVQRPDCLALIDQMMRQVDDFDFSEAKETLEKLQEKVKAGE